MPDEKKQQENSQLLCEVMEWTATWSGSTGKVILDRDNIIISYEQDDGFPNLYEGYRMKLSWKVVEFASGCPWQVPVYPLASANVESLPLSTHFGHWWDETALWAYTSEEAQAAWLDKVVELVLASGRVKKKEPDAV